MANRYWVGGTATWDGTAGTKWALTSGGAGGQAVPTSSDDVFFDAASGAVTVTTSGTTTDICNNLDCTGFTGTLSLATSTTIQIYGNFTAASGMTFTIGAAASSILKFVATSTGKTITTAGKTMPQFVFDGVGGGWTLQDNLTLTTVTPNITLTNGALDTNGKTITPLSLSSNNSNTRSLTLGASSITLRGSQVSWDLSTTTNLTFSGASSTINLGGNGATTFNGGGLTYGTITNTGQSNTTLTINGANTMSELTLSGGAGTTGIYELGANQTVTGTFTSNGNSVINRIFIRSTARGTARTISAGTVTVTNIDLQDITGAGAGSWDLSAVTGGSGDCGGNSSITFTTPANQYWVPSAGTSTGSESAVTRWANASGGTAGTGRSPLPQDTAYFDANSIDAGSRTITQDKPRIGAHIWTGVTNTPTWTTSTIASTFGSITLVSGMTLTGSAQAYTHEGRGSSTITCATKSWAKAWTVNCPGGTLTLGDAFISTGNLTHTSGTFNSSTFNTACAALIIAGGTSTFGSGGITASSNLTVQAASCTCNINGASTFATGITMNSGSNTTSTILNVTANITCSGALSYATGALNITNATITGTNASISGTGSGGGGLACNPTKGFIG